MIQKDHLGNRHVTDPPSVRQDVKTVCAWCNKITQAGSDEVASHGICEECEKVMTDEIMSARRERDAFAPYHDGKCRGPFDFVGEHLVVGFLLFLCIFLIIMAAQGLHWLTGGRVPELIEWQPKAQPLPDNAHFKNGHRRPDPEFHPDQQTKEGITIKTS